MRESLRRIGKEGLYGGVFAYVAVAVVLGLFNVIRGRSFFHTAACMGAVLLHGGEACSRLAIEPGPILAYNGVHLLGSIAVASIASVQIFETELHRAFWYFSFTVMIAAIMYSITFFGVFGVEIGGVLDWPTVVIGTVAWIGSMAGYFWWVHRGLMKKIGRDLESEG
jgi:hypothetical protein